MKKILKCYLLILCCAITADTYGQIQLDPDMYATTTDNKLAIIVKDNAILSQNFVIESNGLIDVELYFKDEDVRNGNYSAKAKPLGNGQFRMLFDELDFQQSDDLTFHATEKINGTIRGYTFINGAYIGESATDISDCPVRISCGTSGSMAIHFPPNILVGPTLGVFVNVTFFSPNLEANGAVIFNGYNLAGNFISTRTRLSSADCNIINTGTVTLNINGHVCTFVAGELVDATNPFTAYGCSSLYDNCGWELIEFFTTYKEDIACLDWEVQYNYFQCSPDVSIWQDHKVAIGTDNFAPNYNLTVKNGVITDKLKMCRTLWCDYVFEPDYQLPSLAEVGAFIEEKKHLPGMPSAAEVEANGGFELNDISFRQQEKIEELFLYLIQQEQEISNLEAWATILELREKLSTH
jgi:hypothetical protein